MTASRETQWRYTRWGSIELAYDFYLGVPAGIIAASAVGFSQEARDSAPGMLIGVAGVSAAVGTLVLTSLTVLLTTLSPEYRAYAASAPGGLTGIARPYRVIVGVAAAGTATGMLGAFLLPLTEPRLLIGAAHLGAWLTVAPSLALCLWATLGCVQLTSQLVSHWQQSLRATEVEARRRQALSRRNIS